ncbi:MAG: HAD-IIIA family hydrolase [Lachnospiraceae bacterium]|nr:HAD-IIIA family hydrolase [Lachnospiraceae bacterium]
MQAVIMAGGKGTRLSSITKDTIPKPMVDVLGKPLLEWQIDVLKRYGIKDICFIVGHLGEKIKDYFQNGETFGIHASYFEEKEPLGTAGSFYYLKKWLKEESFLLIFGDVFFDINLARMIEAHTTRGAEATLFVHPNSHPFDSDLVVLDSNSKVICFDSKHNIRNYWYDNCVNAGLYILNSSICDKVPNPEKKDLESEILAEMVEDGRGIYGYRSPEYIRDIGTVERIESVKRDITSGFIARRSLSNKQKCIFLDRDGTVNKLKGLLYDIDELELEDMVVEAIRRINHSEWLCIVITNQPVVARGLCLIEDVENIHKKLVTLLGNQGVYLDDILFCPHHPDKGYQGENLAYKIPCHCRKPDIGMLEQCAERYNIDLNKSWFVGDTTVDIQTGLNADMHTALVETGEAGKDGKYQVNPEITGKNLKDIVEQIWSLS